MLSRVLEPEVMDSSEEALDYDRMDHAEVNRRFVDDLMAAAPDERAVGFEGRGRRVDVFDQPLQPFGQRHRAADRLGGRNQHAFAAVGKIEPRATARHEGAEQRAEAAQALQADGAVRQQPMRQLRDLTAVRVGRAEDLSRFDAASFDAVYLNSVLHWIEDKARALKEIQRVLKPGGRLGLNVQDPAKPHESRALLCKAIHQAGLGDRHAESHPVLGVGDEELKRLLTEAGFVEYRSGLRSLVEVHRDADPLIRWSEASAFGNFLHGFSDTEREVVRLAFTDLLEAKRVPDGLRLERYLRFAFARKADASPNRPAISN